MVLVGLGKRRDFKVSCIPWQRIMLKLKLQLV